MISSLIYLPCSPASVFRFMSSSVTRPGVTVINSAVAQTPSYGAWPAASPISRQLCLYTSSPPLPPGDKRPHLCHRAVAAIDYHCSPSSSLLSSPSPPASVSINFLFSSHSVSLSIWEQGRRELDVSFGLCCVFM